MTDQLQLSLGYDYLTSDEKIKEDRYAAAYAAWDLLHAPLERHETRTGISPLDHGRIWSVVVYFRAQWKDWAVQAYEHSTRGLVVPAGAPRTYKTLAKARNDAEQLYATVTCSLRVERWPYRA